MDILTPKKLLTQEEYEVLCLNVIIISVYVWEFLKTKLPLFSGHTAHA